MGRPKRVDLGGQLFHVMNRASGRLRIFRKRGDFAAFERIMAEGLDRVDMRICGYCVLGNHWHLLLWPREDGDLSRYMRWITLTHTQRYHAAHATIGVGHLYQGRYKSFPIQGDAHYLTVLRYIEANPLRAGLVERAADHPWSSYAARDGLKKPFDLSPGPVQMPKNWPQLVSKAIARKSQQQLDACLKRGVPFGAPEWTTEVSKRLGLESKLRPQGRPKTLCDPPI